MPFSSSELESLHRQIRFLSGEVTRVRHEHDKRLNAKELVILKKNARYERAQKACSKLKIEHSILREEAQTNAHRVVQLKHEIKLLCVEINAMKQRNKDLEEALAANPSAKLRLKIKLLCVKYHPDHGETVLSSTEVARDLIELLSP
jgi:chromosome segregation ATPase